MPKGKECTRCGRWRTLRNFYRDSRRKDGHESRCKDCDRQRNQEPQRKAMHRACAQRYREKQRGKA